MTSEAAKVLKTTLSLYWRCLGDAARVLVKNFWVPAAELGILLIVSPLVLVVSGLGIIGSFILGLGFAYLVAGFYGAIEGALGRDRLLLSELPARALDLFGPFLGVLFFLFLLNLVLGLFAGGGAGVYLGIGVSLFLGIVFNPLPEAVVTHRGLAAHTFARCLEFIQENVLEWFVPYALVLAGIWWFSPNAAYSLLLGLAQQNPLLFVQELLLRLTAVATQPQLIALAAIVLYVAFFVCAFRLALYQELASSTRRSRIYKSAFGRR